jgi:hypothetical protein
MRARGFETILSGHANRYPGLNEEDMVGDWRWEQAAVA